MDIGTTYVGGSLDIGWSSADPDLGRKALGYINPISVDASTLGAAPLEYGVGYTSIVGGSYSPESSFGVQVLSGTTPVTNFSLNSNPFVAPVPAAVAPAALAPSAAPSAAPAAAEPAAEPAKPAATKRYKVRPGDTLSKIAGANGTSWKQLYELNKGTIGSNPNLIRAGSSLQLP